MDDFTGSELIPLNDLKGTHPEIYEKAFQKYSGREAITQYRLPLLNCLWNDVIHLAPIHPSIVKRNIESLGGQTRPDTKWFKIPARLLQSARAIYFENDAVSKTDYSFPLARINPFIWNCYSELNEIPEHTIKYFQETISQEKRPLLFNGVQHVLCQDRIPIQGCEIIVW